MYGEPIGWRQAAQRALYGPDGFYLRNRPGAHFRTSVHAGGGFAAAVGELLHRVDAALGHPDPIDFVDVGAGGGELVTAVLAAAGQDLGRRLRVTGVDRAPRPPGLSPGIGWSAEIPTLTGLLLANEWLDNIPVDVVQRGADDLDRLVLVAADGTEHPGPVAAGAGAAWLARWWPLTEPGDRAEIGAPRDAAWAAALARVTAGLAVAIDYGHRYGERPPAGTLTGYRNGRQVPPVPDGSCDLTAHVAMDAVASAAPAAPAALAPPAGPAASRTACSPAPVLIRQREALRALGMTGSTPPPSAASTDPAGYLRALAQAGIAGELLDPSGLGGFWWLLQQCPFDE